MSPFEEFAEVVTRRLGATEVKLLPPERMADLASVPPIDTTSDLLEPQDDPKEIILESRLPDGLRISARFEAPTQPIELLQEELDELVATFAETIEASAASDQPTLEQRSRTLRQLLANLAERAGAMEVLVIDAHSPVVWGVAHCDSRPLEEDPAPPDNIRWLHASKRPNQIADAARYQRGAALGVGVIDSVVLDPRILAAIPSALMQRFHVLPLYRSQGSLLVAMPDPTNLDAIRELVLTTGLEIEPVMAPESLIEFVGSWNRRVAKPAPTTDDAPPPSTVSRRQLLADDTVRRLACRYAAREAIGAVRAMPEMPTLRKGGHIHRTVELRQHSIVARSFGTIYVLVVILPERFNEIQAKHAIVQTLPAIESLVVSLPPRSPLGPQGAAGAVRRRS